VSVVIINSEFTKMEECISNSRCESSKSSNQMKMVRSNIDQFDVTAACSQKSLDGLFSLLPRDAAQRDRGVAMASRPSICL